MTITEDEDELFARWQERRKDSVRDGVVSADAYQQQHPKLLFVLKEVNSRKKDLPDLCEFIRKGAKGRTWNAITRWTIGIRGLPSQSDWSDVQTIDRVTRIATLKSIAVMNFKKSPGGASTKQKELAAAVAADADLLAKQFRLYDADVVICCGRSVADLADVAFELDPDRPWKNGVGEVRYKEYQDRKFIISFLHPQQRRVPQEALFSKLLSTVAELRSAIGE
jgi:hypothetical protein